VAMKVHSQWCERTITCALTQSIEPMENHIVRCVTVMCTDQDVNVIEQYI